MTKNQEIRAGRASEYSVQSEDEGTETLRLEAHPRPQQWGVSHAPDLVSVDGRQGSWCWFETHPSSAILLSSSDEYERFPGSFSLGTPPIPG